MKNALIKTVIAGAGVAFLAGCASGQGISRGEAGAMTGAAVGGVVGSRFGGGSGQIASTIAGTMIGAMAGSAIGQMYEREDYQRTQHAIASTPPGQQYQWQNTQTGAQYQYKTTRQTNTQRGVCRDYVINAYMGGQQEQVHGVACRDASGNWVVQ